jgi:hypothetical protein
MVLIAITLLADIDYMKVYLITPLTKKVTPIVE